jgi:hypothetical protein
MPPPQNFGRKLTIRLVLSLGVGAVFVWFMKRAGLDLTPDRSTFAHVKWWTVVAYFFLYGVVSYFRALRWDFLLRPIARVPTRKIIAIGFIGFLAILVLPFRMGEVVRPYLVREKGRITGSAAMGTIAAERVLDGLYVALLLALALLFVPRRDLTGVHIGGFDVARVPQLGYLTVLFFASALTVLAVFLWKRAWAERLTLRLVGVVSPKLAARVAQIVGGLADGLRSLPDPKLMGPFTVYSALYWCTNALTMWLLGWGCGLPMTPGQGFAVMGVLAMGILLPAAPGLFGAFQLAIFAALSMYFPRETVEREGAAYVFLMYVLQLVFHVVSGIIPLVTEKISFVEAFSGGAAGHDEKLPGASEGA